MPTTLVPITEKANGGGGHVWLSLDAGCVLHFDAILATWSKRGAGSFGVMLGSFRKTGSQMVVLRPRSQGGGERKYDYMMVNI